MSSICCKKNGAPYSKYYESAETIEMFDDVRVWLSKNTKKYPQVEPPSNKFLSTLTLQLLQFQEDAFGKNMKSSVLTKLPIKCFNDFTPGGGLCHILGALLKYKNDQGLRRFDFLNPSRLDRNVEVLMMLEKVLMQTGILCRPTVLIDKNVDVKLSLRLSEIICEHQGTVTTEPASATHIVHPQLPIDDATWVTPILHRDKQCLVHFWGFPDSYDTWIPVVDCPTDETFNAKQSKRPCHVHSKWLLDLDVYNEWMNELDYQVTSTGEWIDPSTMRRRERFTVPE